MERSKTYQITYLPIARRDLQDILEYIAFDLEVPDIALNMLNLLESNILSLQENPFRGAIFSSARKHNHQYRRLFVKNYVIFYLVLDETVEIQRIFYNRRDIDTLV